MRELLSNNDFMTWALGVGVYLMFAALGWKTTGRSAAAHGPGVWGWLQLRPRSLPELLNPVFWLALAVGLPSLLVRRALAELHRRRAVAAMRRAGLRLR
jgi:hypothetical protein